jgi:cytochrome c5
VGFAFAQLCQKFGMNVALVDKSAEGLEKAKEVLSGNAKNGQRTEVYDMVCHACHGHRRQRA